MRECIQKDSWKQLFRDKEGVITGLEKWQARMSRRVFEGWLLDEWKVHCPMGYRLDVRWYGVCHLAQRP